MSRVLITGSAQGLGLMAAGLLAGGGHSVTLHARSAARAQDARAALPAAKAVVVGDLSSIAGMRQVAEQANAGGPYDAVLSVLPSGAAADHTEADAASGATSAATREVRWTASRTLTTSIHSRQRRNGSALAVTTCTPVTAVTMTAAVPTTTPPQPSVQPEMRGRQRRPRREYSGGQPAHHERGLTPGTGHQQTAPVPALPINWRLAVDMPGIFPTNFEANAESTTDPDRS